MSAGIYLEASSLPGKRILLFFRSTILEYAVRSPIPDLCQRWVESIADQVVGRLAGDQRGAVLDALVSEGMMEVLLSIIQGNASSSVNSRTAESGLALLFLADLSAGSERAKVRRSEAIGEIL